MKKNYLLLLVFLILGSATAWYVLNQKGGETTTLGWDRKFKVENPEEIQKIFIGKRTGENTILERQGKVWVVNGKHKVSPNAMENLLEAVTQMELKFVPPKAAIDNLAKELSARGIKVEIYNKKGDKIRVYYVGGVTPDARGTVMIMENSEQPMVMEIPQMEGQIRTRFDLTGDAWRDRSVFAYQPEEIQAVSIEYPQQRSKSFRLNRKGNSFEVSPFYENTPTIKRAVDKASVEAFLFGFNSLVAEAFQNQLAGRDSISQTIPFAVISVTDTKGEERKAALFPTYRTNVHSGERVTDEVERYFAAINNGDWMLVQHRVFEKVFWPYEAMFEPEPTKVKN